MKRITSIIIILLSILIVFSSCGKNSKVTDSKNSDAGEIITNSDDTKVNTVVAVGKSALKEESKGITTQKTTSVTTTKKSYSTTKVPVTTTQTPMTTTASNPYGYKNAWASVEKMEEECNAYINTKSNFSYDSRLYVGIGYWFAPGTDNYGFTSAQNFKSKILSNIDYACDPYYNDCGYDTLKVVFLTKANYKNKVSPEYQSKFENYLMYDDEIMVITVFGNALDVY